jgi:hypothetical protein
MIAVTVPYEGDSANPLLQYAEDISLDTEDERKAYEASMRPEDNLQVGGFERLSQFMSMTR